MRKVKDDDKKDEAPIKSASCELAARRWGRRARPRVHRGNDRQRVVEHEAHLSGRR